jgi:hypothetical protein
MNRLHNFIINLSHTFKYQNEIMIFLIYDNSLCIDDFKS